MPRPPTIVLGAQARQVLELGILGLADKEIARRLGMSPATVRTHFARLCQRYGATNRCQLAHIATKLGLFCEDGQHDDLL